MFEAQGDVSFTPKDQQHVFEDNLRFAQNRKDFVMRTKAEYYSQMNEQKNLVGEKPTFKPAINQKKVDQGSNGKRYESILEKGKAYQDKLKESQVEKMKEQLEDPELTFKPKINQPKKQKAPERKDIFDTLYSQGEKYWNMKFDRMRDAIEYTQEPDQYTFKPEILGNKRSGKVMPTYTEMKANKVRESRVQSGNDIVNIGDDSQNQADNQESIDLEEPTSVRIDIALGDQRHRITLFADSDAA